MLALQSTGSPIVYLGVMSGPMGPGVPGRVLAKRGGRRPYGAEFQCLLRSTRGISSAFVSYGPSRSDDDASETGGEIYGLYVQPDAWSTGRSAVA